MIKLIIKKTIKNYKDTENEKVREEYGVLAGVLGIICNFVLFILKLSIGTIMNSIAITSDAMNNLSDMGSSVISIVSSKMSNQKPDKDHPFGHGRIEYVGSLIVSFIIILVGFELLKSSIEKIIHPEIITFNIILVIILALSVLIKLWMFSYNKYISRVINSSLMEATAHDSLNDSISTGAVILSLFIGQFTTLPIDAIMGLLVSIFILVSGVKLAKEVIDVILGTPPSLETVKKISDIVLSGEEIVGIHDLIIHEYGPGRVFASVHAEVPDDVNIVKVHEVIDALEQRVQKELNFVLVIHMDPISLNDEKTQKIKKMLTEIVSEISSDLSIHDFRMTDGENNINLIFDLVVPIETSTEDRKKYVEIISNKLKEIDNRYNTVIQIDNAY